MGKPALSIPVQTLESDFRPTQGHWWNYCPIAFNFEISPQCEKAKRRFFFEKVALSESRLCPKRLRDRADGQRKI